MSRLLAYFVIEDAHETATGFAEIARRLADCGIKVQPAPVARQAPPRGTPAKPRRIMPGFGRPKVPFDTAEQDLVRVNIAKPVYVEEGGKLVLNPDRFGWHKLTAVINDRRKGAGRSLVSESAVKRLAKDIKNAPKESASKPSA